MWYELWGVVGVSSLIWVIIFKKLVNDRDRTIVRNGHLAVENVKLREELVRQCTLFAKTLKQVLKK